MAPSKVIRNMNFLRRDRRYERQEQGSLHREAKCRWWTLPESFVALPYLKIEKKYFRNCRKKSRQQNNLEGKKT